MTDSTTAHLLSPETRASIDAWLTKYPANQKRSGVIEALRYAQAEHDNWLPVPVMNAVADYLDLPHIAVYEVASFYTMFNLKPVAKHVIEVCTNVSCMLSHCDKIVSHLQQKLKVGFNEQTPDKKFEIREVECLAACRVAPVMQIGKHYYEELTPDKVDAILAELE